MISDLRNLPRLAVLAFLLLASPAHALWEQNGVAVCSMTGDQTRPVVVVDGQSGAYIVWEDARTLPPQVYAQHLDALGNPLWQAGGILVSSGFYSQTAPVAVHDGVGGVIIAWILELVPGARTAQGQRLNSSGSPLWAAGGIPVTPGAAFPVQLAIISDNRLGITSTPGAILAWTDIRSGSTTDIYAQAIDANGVARWGSNGVTVCTAPLAQADLVMVTDGSAPTLSSPRGAILAWRDERVSETNPDIYAQRLNSAGVPQWTADGLPVCTDGSRVLEPVIVPAGSGTAIVSWPDGRTGRTYDLYAQRVGSAGSWVADGLPVAPPNEGQTSPAAIADGAGGILVTWSGIAGLNRNIYAQRLNGTGSPYWPAAGVTVTAAVGLQNKPVIVTDRASGAVIAWIDSRTGLEIDLYAQHVNAAGAALWNPDGVPLCTATGDQTELAAAPDTTGGAIVAWTDTRSGGTDIYAQRVTGWGGVVAVESDLASSPSLRLGAPFPNPARGGVTFRLDLPSAREVTAEMFDVSGKRVRTLLAQQRLSAGGQALTWDGEDDGRVRVPPGVYWLSVRAGADEGRRRAVILH